MQAYAILSRNGLERNDFVMYVAMVDSKEAALEGVRAQYSPKGELEVSGFVRELTVRVLGLRDGEIRHL